jgi:hypothetical protein
VQLTQFSTLVDSAGTGSFTTTGNDSLSGTIPTGQSITVIGGASASGVLDLLGNVTNDGNLTLEDEAGGGAAELSNDAVADRMLTNKGTFTTEGASGDPVDINSDLVNDKKAVVTLGAVNTNEEGYANITNEGKFTVSAKDALDETGGSQASTTFTQGGGSLTNKGTILLNSADFAASGGTESGHPVQLTDFSGLIDSAGSGSYTLLGQSSLSGTIPTGQTVTVRGNSADGTANVDLAPNVTNDGTLILDSTSSADTAGIGYESNTNFTNNGTFDANGANGGNDVINTPFANDGRVTINALTVGDPYQTIANNGTFTITPNNEFETTGGSQAETDFNNQGTLDNEGSFILDNSTVNLNSSGTYEATFGASGDTPSTLSGVPSNSGDSGTVSLGGTLEIATVGTPSDGTQYAVVGGSTSVTDTTGTFASYEFGTQNYTVSYTSNGMTVTVS